MTAQQQIITTMMITTTAITTPPLSEKEKLHMYIAMYAHCKRNSAAQLATDFSYQCHLTGKVGRFGQSCKIC